MLLQFIISTILIGGFLFGFCGLCYIYRKRLEKKGEIENDKD